MTPTLTVPDDRIEELQSLLHDPDGIKDLQSLLQDSDEIEVVEYSADCAESLS